MSETITIKCESCDEVREAMRQFNRTLARQHQLYERLIAVLSEFDGKRTKQRPAELNGNSSGRELITVTEFSTRVHRCRRTVHRWLRLRQMPEGTVFYVHGHPEIDWNAWQKSVEGQGR